MGKRTLNLDDNTYNYLLSFSIRETPLEKALREETDKLEMGMMQIPADQAQFMALLVKLLNAQKVIEVGTFTGYSALAVAKALPENGQIIACDISEEWTSIGKRYWQEAGVSEIIDLRLAPALETLTSLVQEGQSGSFDFAFIDADKENQLQYYELCLQLIRPAGLIAIDNVLWGGSVIDTAIQDEATVAIREFNQQIYQDSRVEISMVPIGDGLTLALKKQEK